MADQGVTIDLSSGQAQRVPLTAEQRAQREAAAAAAEAQAAEDEADGRDRAALRAVLDSDVRADAADLVAVRAIMTGTPSNAAVLAAVRALARIVLTLARRAV